jgi:U3 small nucleolar RNA-associated protein 15
VKLVSGSNDLSIKLWDLQSNEAIQEFPHAHDDLVKEALFANKEENLIISGGYDRLVKIWDTRISNPLVASGEHELPIESLAFGQTTDYLVSTFGNSCALWDIRQMFSKGPVVTLRPHLKTILALAYDRVRNRIITGGADSMLKFSDPNVRTQIIVVDRKSIVLNQNRVSTYCF